MYREQRDRSSIAGSVGARYQFDFHFKDRDLFRDCRRIIVRAVDLTNAERSAPPGEKKHVGKFLREFVGRFFWDAAEEFADELEEEKEEDEDESEDKADSTESQNDAAYSEEKNKAAAISAAAAAAGKSTTPAIQVNGGDATTTSASSTTTTTTAAGASSSTAMDVDVKEQPPAKTALLPKRPSYTLYGNTQMYIFFRQFQVKKVLKWIVCVVYSRL